MNTYYNMFSTCLISLAGQGMPPCLVHPHFLLRPSNLPQPMRSSQREIYKRAQPMMHWDSRQFWGHGATAQPGRDRWSRVAEYQTSFSRESTSTSVPKICPSRSFNDLHRGVTASLTSEFQHLRENTGSKTKTKARMADDGGVNSHIHTQT